MEPFLRECLESVLNQKTKYSYVVIAIDDGSTDNSLSILREYEDKITVISQANGGAATARNKGLQTIYGEYIMFVDSDDVILPGTIETLLDIAYKENADIVEGKTEHFATAYPKIKNKNKTKDLNGDFSLLRGYPVAKVIRSTIFKDIIFPEGYDYEDSIMAYWVHPSSKKSLQTTRTAYGYRNNPSSATSRVNAKPKCLETIYISLGLWNIHIKHFGPSLPFNKIVLRQMALNHMRIANLERQHPGVQKDAFAITSEAYLSMFPKPIKGLRGKERLLDKILRKGDYGQYRLLCNRWTKLPS